jgi:hypothetical protein
MNAFQIPARRLYWAAFASSAIFALIGFGLMWIARDQSMTWSMAWYAAAHGLLPGTLMLIVGLFLRQRYLRRSG